jgi:ribosomal protein S18 acetylase RimI-like enzyme
MGARVNEMQRGIAENLITMTRRSFDWYFGPPSPALNLVMNEHEDRIIQRPHAGGEASQRLRSTPVAVKLREGTESDNSALVEIEAACFDDPHERFDQRKILYLLRSARVSVRVVESDCEILGWAAGFASTDRPTPWGRIYALAVHPRARGMKLGTTLTTNMIEMLRQRGAKRIFLEVKWGNTSAIRLYEKLGFKSCRHLKDYYGPGLDAQRMEFVCDG